MDTNGEIKQMWKLFFALLAMLVIVSLVLTAVNGFALPWQLGMQRNAVEQSRSFIDSRNTQAINKIERWFDLERQRMGADPDTAMAIEGQQQFLYENICALAQEQNRTTVLSQVRLFLAEHGNCRI